MIDPEGKTPQAFRRELRLAIAWRAMELMLQRDVIPIYLARDVFLLADEMLKEAEARELL